MNPRGVYDIVIDHIDKSDDRLQQLLKENAQLKKEHKKLCQIVEFSNVRWCNACGRTMKDQKEMFFKCCVCHKPGCVYCCPDIFYCFKCQEHAHTACLSADGSYTCDYDLMCHMDEFKYWSDDYNLTNGCTQCKSPNWYTTRLTDEGIPPICCDCSQDNHANHPPVDLTPKRGNYPLNF